MIRVKLSSRSILLSYSRRIPSRLFSTVATVRLSIFYLVSKYGACPPLACNLNVQCRTFDYDSSSLLCRLFGGAFSTGHVVPAVTTSRIGFVEYLPLIFKNFGQPCSQNLANRYMACLNNTFECPLHSYWSGSVCENQRYENASCLNDDWCRNDPFGLTCSSSNICTSKDYPRFTVELEIMSCFITQFIVIEPSFHQLIPCHGTHKFLLFLSYTTN